MSNRWLFSFLVLVLVVPAHALAAVTFGEVGYDVPGADTGREWVEITNTGDAVDFTGWRFVEGGVNHKLVPQGSAILPSGASAVIVQSPEQYLADHPLYTGLMFKSSFSLNNTGETISLKDASSTIMASITYTPTPKSAPAPAATPKGVPAKSKVISTPKTAPKTASVATTSVAAVAPVVGGWGPWPWAAAGAVVLAALGIGVYIVRNASPAEYAIKEVE